MTERRPFERLPGETSKAFAAFVCYRDLPPRKRSLRAAAMLFYEANPVRNLSQMKRWSSRGGWVKRSEAFDDWLDARRREKTLEMILASVKVAKGY